MVARVVRAALTHRAVVFLLAGVLIAAGLQAVRTAPLGVFPEFAPPIVEIQAESPGMGAEDVEALVTTPIERALGGTAHLDTLRSSSVPGLAAVTAVFPYGTDPDRARQAVRALALVAEPAARGAVVSPPRASGLPTILVVGLRAARRRRWSCATWPSGRSDRVLGFRGR
jgi:multidrug efflux pump subunit AcrB